MAEVAKAMKRTEGAVRQRAKTVGVGLGHHRRPSDARAASGEATSRFRRSSFHTNKFRVIRNAPRHVVYTTKGIVD